MKCPKCGHRGVMNFEYDAKYCPVHLIWLEGICGHPDCEYCGNRPGKASRIPPTPAEELSRAKALIAAVDAAEETGVEMTDENLRSLGYVKDEGDGWELPIPGGGLRNLLRRVLVFLDRGRRPISANLSFYDNQRSTRRGGDIASWIVAFGLPTSPFGSLNCDID